MEGNIIETNLAPDMGGLDPQGVIYKNSLFVSGQIGMTPLKELPDDFETQAKNAFFNLKAIVEAAGSRLDRSVRVTICLTDISKIHEMNIIYGRFFRSSPPSREVVQVSALKKGAQIQVSAETYIRLDA